MKPEHRRLAVGAVSTRSPPPPVGIVNVWIELPSSVFAESEESEESRETDTDTGVTQVSDSQYSDNY